MPHEVHVSERRSFRGCKRRHDWAYRQGYTPLVKAKPLEFGIAYHIGMEEFYNPATWADTTAAEKAHLAVTKFAEECEKQRANYLKTVGLRELTGEDGDDYEARIELGTGMLAYHAQFVHSKYDGWFKPVMTEVSFRVPIEDPDYDDGRLLKCLNSPACGQLHSNNPESADSNVTYDGRVDMLVEDIRYGGYYIWDHKTAMQLAADDGFLQLDDQVGSYCWALKKQLNIDIRGFIYAESRKDFPHEPKLLKRKMNGRQFSTAANQATSIEIFKPFVQKHDPIAYKDGAYTEYIGFLSGADAILFHQRFTIIKSARELTEIGKNIGLEAADMVDSNLRVYPSVGRFTCSSCAFRQPCLGTFMGEDVEYLLESDYLKTDRRYWQDQPRNSDKKGK